MASQFDGLFLVGFRCFWRPSSQTVDIAVVHAKGRRDQHGIVDLMVGGPFLAGALHILGLDGMSSEPDLLGDI